MKKTVVLIDDEQSLLLLMRAVLEEEGWQVFTAVSAQEGLDLLQVQPAHAVVLDIQLPDLDGVKTLKKIMVRYPHLPVIMLTAYGSIESAVQTLRGGAFHYLTKPASNTELVEELEKAYQYSMYHAANDGTLPACDDEPPLCSIIGISPAINQVRDFIKTAAPTDSTVLILGESGTGKELIANAIHGLSLRKDKAFVAINCAVLPGDLLESELFGYRKGAFTGATQDKPGRFQLANGGTLFLDEIGEMPLALQAKLLRALQERVVEPLGGITSDAVDVRIVAATNVNLWEKVENKEFRQDLFYRLAVLEVVSPALQDRLEDLPMLVSGLLEKLGKRTNKHITQITSGFLEALQNYPWPGNVRELENALERALIFCKTKTLREELLPQHIQNYKKIASISPKSRFLDVLSIGQEQNGTPLSLEDAELKVLQAALEANHGHREKTAEALGISRRALQYKLKKFDLLKKDEVELKDEIELVEGEDVISSNSVIEGQIH